MRRAITPLVVMLAVTACERATAVPTELAVPTPARVAADVEPPQRTAAALLEGAWASDDGSAVERWVGVGEHLVGVGFTSLDRAFAADSAGRGGAAWAERFEAKGSTWSRGSTRRDGPEAIGAGIDTMRAGGHRRPPRRARRPREPHVAVE